MPRTLPSDHGQGLGHGTGDAISRLASRIVVLLGILSVLVPAVRAEDFPAEKIHGQGPEDNRIHIMLVGDGWSRDEIDRGSYREFCDKLKTNLLATPPFTHYANFIQVTRVDVPSRDSGITDKDNGARDTYFRTQFNDYPPWFQDEGWSRKRLEETNARMPRHVMVVVMNHPGFGGAARHQGTSSVSYCTLTTDSPTDKTFPHEIGHALVNLADEYDGDGDPPRSEPDEANVTILEDPERVKWSHWIRAKPDVIGLFEGAKYTRAGCWRPREQCMMRTGGGYCEVCVERTIQRLYETITLVESAYPESRSLKLETDDEGASEEFMVSSIDPGTGGPRTLGGLLGGLKAGARIAGEWFLDGRSLEGQELVGDGGRAFRLQLGPEQLTIGRHTVRFLARDDTALVEEWAESGARRLPNRVEWQVNVEKKGGGFWGFLKKLKFW